MTATGQSCPPQRTDVMTLIKSSIVTYLFTAEESDIRAARLFVKSLTVTTGVLAALWAWGWLS